MRPGLKLYKKKISNNNKNFKLMKKKLLIAAIAITALASCSNEDFVGDQNLQNSSGTNGAIQFISNTPAITRAERTEADAASDLGYSFAVYATKTVGAVTSNVFAHNEYSASSNTPYWVWYTTSTANTTTSNTANWEYVGKAASGEPLSPTYGTSGHEVTLTQDQTIKYWDYSADNYIFTAYKNNAGGTVSNVNITDFTFEGTASAFAGLFVADKVVITEKANPAVHGSANNKIGNAVKFKFRSGAAKVRLGIYETIPGYNVKNVNFKPTTPATFSETTTSAQLSGSFNGSSPSTSQSFTVTFGTGGASFATSADISNNYVFGTFDTDGDPYLGETSTSPTWANASSSYIDVLPNQDHTAAMVLSVDFDLYNTITHETIHVEDAKAVVPATYMTWNPNYAYTYLFKICDNTNGYTGSDATLRGLYPITFDAVTIAGPDVETGYITTLTTPSIITYQNGSVSASGITYANANDGPITITVNTNGTLATLSNTTAKLYRVAAGTTEADLLLASGYEKTEVSSGTDVMSVSGTEATFTPTANTTYAFEYSKDAVSTTYKKATGTYVSGIKYYTDGTGATEVDTTGFEEGVTNVTSYYVVDVAGSPAVKAYKIIQVVPAS